MKVLVASTLTPFVNGGADILVTSLATTLREHGHEVELFNFPFHSAAPEILDQMLGFRLLDMSQHADRLIAVRPPSYLLRHPNKVVWFIHHHRGAYDLWGTRYQDLPLPPEGLAYRDAIRSADNLTLREAKLLFCNSQRMASRLKEFNGLDAEVLYPPLPGNSAQPGCGPMGDYLVYVSRLTHHKRQWLALEALRHTLTPVKLVIAGAIDPSCASYLDDLQLLIRRYGLSSRVTLISRWVSEEEKTSLLNHCLGVVYLPFDEDSYGYPTLEAYHSSKPVITTTDAGGTIELVRDKETGFVATSDPEAIASAMDQLYSDRELASRLGHAAFESLRAMNISWDHVVQRLLAPVPARA